MRRHALRPLVFPLAGFGLLGASAWWAFAPVDVRIPSTIDKKIPVEPVSHAFAEPLAPVDEASFRTPIWVAPAIAAVPPAPDPPPPPAPPPTPPRNLQLLAIVRERAEGDGGEGGGGGGGYKAVIYDRDTDQVFTVSAGERVGGHTIASVSERMLTLGDSAPGVSLLLDPDKPEMSAP